MSFGDKKLSEIAVSVPGSTSLLRKYDLDFLQTQRQKKD